MSETKHHNPLHPPGAGPVTSDCVHAKRLSRVLTHLPAAVVVVDGLGRVSEANAAAQALLQTAEDTNPLLGQSWLQVIARSFQPQADDGHDITTRSGRRVNISTTPLSDEPGQIVLIKDVTETRALQSELAQKTRLISLGQMVASLAHQIRTPVASALLYASHLGKDSLPADDRNRFADKLIERLAHMEHLIQDMLGFASGGEARDPDAIEVETLLDDATAAMDGHPQAGHVRIEHRRGDPLWIRGERPALLGALQNLLSNALTACDPGGLVQIAARPGYAHVDIVVSDNGRGMDAATREQALEPFFSTSAGGTGLGLAVVDTVVRSHFGQLHIESSPGQGSRFLLRLPRPQTGPTESPQTPLPAQWPGARHRAPSGPRTSHV